MNNKVNFRVKRGGSSDSGCPLYPSFEPELIEVFRQQFADRRIEKWLAEMARPEVRH
jgi:hypothetical protein